MRSRSPWLALLMTVSLHVGPALAAQTCGAPRLALVIGNAAYPDNEAPLQEPVGNARVAADALKTLGFATTEAEDLTRDKMLAALAAFEDTIKPDSIVVLLFSGYGIQSGGHSYLVPVDAKLWSEQDVKTFGIGLDRILADVAARGAAVRIAVVDAARRNPYERRFRLSGSAGLAPVNGAPGTLALFSSAPGATFDEAGGPTSPFVDALVRQIKKTGARAEDAFRRTRVDVSHVARAGQTPWISSFLSEDVAMNGRECVDTPSAQAPPASPAPSTAARPAVAAPVAATEPAAPPKDQPAKDQPAKDQPAKAVDRPTATTAPLNPPEPAQVAVPAPKAATPRPLPAPTPPIPSGAAVTKPIARPPTILASRADTPVDDPALLDEIKDRLFEQNLDPGEPGSPEMTAALRTFEDGAGLPHTDRPTMRLLRGLREARSLKPWGAITFSRESRTWGMSWGSASRREALAVARARCGSDRCFDQATFYGPRCGAFALSTRSWSITWREGAMPSREAALDDCGKRGSTCRVIGAVCADGASRYP